MTYILIDLDDTIYPASSGLHKEIDRRITEFVSRFLNIGFKEAQTCRRNLVNKYGTTLEGLVKRHGLSDMEQLLEYIHPANIANHLRKDPGLRQALSSIPLPKSILTNAPIEHAGRVLNFLGVREIFEHIFDIRFNRFQNKPRIASYTNALKFLSKEQQEVLLVDDRLDYLIPFRDLGAKVLLVDENDNKQKGLQSVPHIRNIKQLPEFLEDQLPENTVI